jgi:hypothetical protein
MIFFANTFKEKKFYKLLSDKKNVIFDFGCGVGIWNKSNLNKKIKKIFLYDKNEKAILEAKKKYKRNKKIFFIKKKNFFNNKIFFKKNKIDIILINSVIQYIAKTELKKILTMLDKNNLNSRYKIIITDIPIHNRIIEIFLLLFFDFNRFLDALKLLINFSYHKTLFYHNSIDMIFLEKIFNVKEYQNLNKFKFRKTLILTKKN